MKLRVLAKFIEVYNRRIGGTVRYERGDVIVADDFEPSVVHHLFLTLGPRDGSDAVNRLIEEHGREWTRREADGKQDWREPAWFRSRLIPAVEEYNPHAHLPPRDEHGRFIHEG